ncbi:MAG: hypothetical protein DI539_22195 [Flavobacterium psychrophilum]|nr:MAG: hypothetical protein DI539_22195 [Flavobacterium psychrophilum]
MEKVITYIVERMENVNGRYDIDRFDSGAVMIDCWIGERLYNIQLEGNKIGLSLVTEDTTWFDTIPDQLYENIDDFKPAFENTLTGRDILFRTLPQPTKLLGMSIRTSDKIILKYSGLLLLCHLINWWILFKSAINIPAYIPSTPISISGLLLITITIILSVFFIKAYLKMEGSATVLTLTLACLLMNSIAETLFQFIRIYTLENLTQPERTYLYLRSVVTSTLFAGGIGGLVALNIKGLSLKWFFAAFGVIVLVVYIYQQLTQG